MGIFDKAREPLPQQGGTVEAMADRVGGGADRRTGGKHRAHLDRGADLTQDEPHDQTGRDTTPEP